MDDEWLQMFKDDYIMKGKHDLQSQVPYLSALAADYEDRYQTSNNWTDCLKAHAIYSSCGAREPSSKKWSKHAYSLQQAYWKGRETIDYQSQQQLTESLSKEINKIRSDFRLEVELMYKECDTLFPPSLAHLEDQTPLSTGRFNDMMKDVSIRCTEQMIGFACRIMEGAVDALKERPPCPFTVAAIGSLARGEATPYSDLEYMFIIEDKTENTVKYFETLAVTSYFLIGSLRETKLSYMAISELDGWFEDFSTNGFKIDGLSPGAGNIPTGNGSNEGNRNHFLLTSEELIERYRATLDNPIEKEALRGDLTAMLAYIKPIFSFGDNMFVPEIKRAVSDMTPNAKREDINMRMLQADIKKFDFTPDNRVRAKGFELHLKKDIFRFPSILLLDLTQVFQVTGESTWETLDLLLQNNSISQPLHTALNLLVTSACFIRLSAYLYHDSQDDRMSVAPESAQLQLKWTPFSEMVSRVVRKWYPPSGLFFSMMDCLVPLKRLLDTEIEAITEEMKSFTKIQPTWADKVRALYCCERVSAALKVLQDEFGTDLYDDTVRVVKEVTEHFPSYLDDIVGVLFHNSWFQQALVFNSFIEMSTSASDDKKTRTEWWRMQIHSTLGNMEEVKMMLKSSRIEAEHLYENIGMLHINKAESSKDRTELLEAEHCYLKALALHSRASHRDIDMLSAGTAKHDITTTSLQQSDIDSWYDELLAASRSERLSMIRIVSINVIRSLMMLGSIYDSMKEHKSAEIYYWRCEAMFVQLFGEKTMTVERAVLYQKIGSNLNYLNRYEESERTSLRAIEMYKEVYGKDCAHSDIIMVYNDLGFNADEVEDYNKAEVFYQKALDMNKKLVTRNADVNSLMGSSLFGLGNSYHGMKRHAEAVEYCLQALKVYEDVYVNTKHIEVARVLNNLGIFHEDLKQFNKAEEYHFKALTAFKGITGAEEDVARVLKNIGYCYRISQKYKKCS